MVSIRVFGTPRPKGSWKTTKKGRFIPTNKLQEVWPQIVAQAALVAMRDKEPWADTCLTMRAIFAFNRPAGHYKTSKGKKTDTLKGSAPILHRVAPDLDKLLRSVGDALTGIVYDDDSRISSFCDSAKIYVPNGVPEGVYIEVFEPMREKCLDFSAYYQERFGNGSVRFDRGEVPPEIEAWLRAENGSDAQSPMHAQATLFTEEGKK